MMTLKIERRRHIPGFEADIAAHQHKRERGMKAITRRKYFCGQKKEPGPLYPGFFTISYDCHDYFRASFDASLDFQPTSNRLAVIIGNRTSPGFDLRFDFHLSFSLWTSTL